MDTPEPHRERTRTLLAAHPEAKDLCGNMPSSALWVAAIVGFQLALAFALRDSPWWLIAVLAYAVGAVADHALWVLIHEATHNLVFRSSAANAWTAIAANLPIVFPGAIAFRKYHLLHHAHQGTPELDADLPSPLEARLVGNSAWRKALWLLLYFAAQALRVPRLKKIRLVDGWYLANLAVELAFLAVVIALAGWKAFAFLLLASVFAIGLHPVGGRWLQEHYLTIPGAGEQETFSYYGPMNLFAFNVGYHNEHHDLMRVPWSRLPALRRLAPELYDGLHHHRSWGRLVLRFILDPSLSLYSRATRNEAEAEAGSPTAARSAV
ncbi:MAG TPA: fatty acid desaturase [Anaeromyxobacteraceae bacterium]|nr:fatty acid desaturase [Anaeromyxobacteraceae bacterium]